MDVSSRLGQIEAHSGHGVAAGPEMLAGEVPLLATKLPRDGYSTLAFQKANHLCHRMFGRNRDTDVDMIGQQMPLDNLTLFLAGQRMENRAQLAADPAIQLAPAPPRAQHDMILAGPPRLRQTQVSGFHRSS